MMIVMMWLVIMTMVKRNTWTCLSTSSVQIIEWFSCSSYTCVCSIHGACHEGGVNGDHGGSGGTDGDSN